MLIIEKEKSACGRKTKKKYVGGHSRNTLLPRQPAHWWTFPDVCVGVSVCVWVTHALHQGATTWLSWLLVLLLPHITASLQTHRCVTICEPHDLSNVIKSQGWALRLCIFPCYTHHNAVSTLVPRGLWTFPVISWVIPHIAATCFRPF